MVSSKGSRRGARWALAWLLALVLVASGALATSSVASSSSGGHGTAHISDSCGAGCTCPGICQDAIVGIWGDRDGKIQFTGGGGTYTGHMLQANSAQCGSQDPNVRVTGGFGRYSGKIAYYRTDDNSCSPVGDGTITINVAPGSLSASYSTNPPPGIGCCTGSGSYIKPGAAAPGADYVARARQAFTFPCDIQSAIDIMTGKGDADACGKSIPNRVVAAKGAGAIVCGAATGLSGAERFTPITTGKQVTDCIKDYSPGKRQLRASAAAKRIPAAKATNGTYTGFTVPVGKPNQVPTRKQIKSAALSSAKHLLHGGSPANASEMSFTVGAGIATITQDLTLTCANGSSIDLPIDGDLSFPIKKSFKDSYEDTFAASAVQGKFVRAKFGRKHRVAAVGAIYVSASQAGSGPCSTFVAFATRGPQTH